MIPYIENRQPDAFDNEIPSPRNIRKSSAGLFHNFLASVLGNTGGHHEPIDPQLARMRANAEHYAKLNAEARGEVPIVGIVETVIAAVRAMVPAKSAKPPTPREKAMTWLKTALAGGPLPANEIAALAKKEGFSARTLRRGASALNVIHVRKGRESWNWSLPKEGQP